MAEQDSPPVNLDSIARIVSSYVRHHQIEPDQLAGLIVEVHRGLASLGRGTPSVQVPPQPAVSIRQSVQRDYVVCLECGVSRPGAAAPSAGCSTGLRLPRTVPAGNCRPITR
jgi:predicted transcriptional regulator